MAIDDEALETQTQVLPWALFLIALVLVAALIVLAYGGAGESPLVTEDQQQGAPLNTTPTTNTFGGVGGAAATTTIEDMLDNPVATVGNAVTVRGEVERPIGPRAFILDEPGIRADQILVLTSNVVVLEEGDAVVVKGTVRSMTVAGVEQRYGVDLTSALATMVLEHPVIVASSITVESP